ncbi:fimbrial protein [Pantoea sp. NPDC088449]|uniref:Major type 1 subunit fimbrin (Pilin) n=1 Tax=Candidatus Pantoea floridensis TaxID=1938870 RepID=A0A286BXM4_9GAMM|nr:fimbrial protein [Pantoea floridensis]PIF21397.1 major type 1 subunit fimbrin (pilin) [Enterobacteriaceae bacterium JKS000233]SOD38909.1 major type 1 subunit fimbrin (pilin) [Pantoea floridensis]
MMKKSLILAVLAGSALVSTAHAASGTLNFTGTVSADACTVSPTTKSQNIDLGRVATSDFSAIGATSGSRQISIDLTACPAAITAAAVNFTGPTHADNRKLLALSGASTAKNLGIALFEDDGVTLIPIGSTSKSQNLTTTATLTYFAKYQSTAATVTDGTAEAAADFTIVYN